MTLTAWRNKSFDLFISPSNRECDLEGWKEGEREKWRAIYSEKRKGKK